MLSLSTDSRPTECEIALLSESIVIGQLDNDRSQSSLTPVVDALCGQQLFLTIHLAASPLVGPCRFSLRRPSTSMNSSTVP
jgi:hypothetical protein